MQWAQMLKRLRYEWDKMLRRIRRAILPRLPGAWLCRWADHALRFRIALQEAMRQREARRSPVIEPPRQSWVDQSVLVRCVLESHAPWSHLAPVSSQIPGMLTVAERQYYMYLPQFYTGVGEVVELGPWLGLSTSILIQALQANPHFDERSLHVYDDFVWRSSWMNKWLKDASIQSLDNHESFLPLFLQLQQATLERLTVTRCKIADFDGNEALPPLQWEQGPIELIVVDCGRQWHVNEAWYRVFSPHFIPDVTLIVMQDWQNHKRVPEVFWENTKMFTDSKQGQLELLHEVNQAGIGTFLYRAT